jgi:hypothetical protein
MTPAAHSFPPGLWRDEHHRYYYNGKGPLPSVTTITGILDKSGPLVGWAKRETAACAVRNIDMLTQMIQSGGKEAAQAWLSAIPDYQRDEAADMGSRIHALADAHTRGEDIKPTGLEVPYLRAWYAFLKAIQPRIFMSETLIANLTLGFGGTFDIGAEIDGVNTLLDIKTGRRVYPETALQLAGYDLAELTATADDPTPLPLPKWERHGVVHLQPDEWELIPFDLDVGDAREAFKTGAATLWRWNKEASPWVMGKPVTETILEGLVP